MIINTENYSSKISLYKQDSPNTQNFVSLKNNSAILKPDSLAKTSAIANYQSNINFSGKNILTSLSKAFKKRANSTDKLIEKGINKSKKEDLLPLKKDFIITGSSGKDLKSTSLSQSKDAYKDGKLHGSTALTDKLDKVSLDSNGNPSGSDMYKIKQDVKLHPEKYTTSDKSIVNKWHHEQDINNHDITTPFGGDVNDVNHIDVDDLTSDLELHDTGTPFAGVLDNVADVLENPIIEGALAEVLPGTKFLKPLEHLADGDVDKALVTGSTRAAEFFALAPVKLAVTAFGALKGALSRVAGDKGEGTGIIGGFKSALKFWNKGREIIEDGILGVEKKKVTRPTEAQIEEKYKKIEEQVLNNVRSQEKQLADKRDKNYNEKMISYKKDEIEANKLEQEATGKTIFYKEQSNIANNQFVQETKMSNEKLQKLFEEKEKLAKEHKDSVEKLSKEIEIARKQNDKKTQELLKQQIEKIQKLQKSKMETLSINITKATQAAEIYEKMANKSNAKGFKKIAGYDEEKNILLNHFGTSIALEKNGKNAKVPGGIMFFGPKGTGKSIFATALAGQLDCEPVKIRSGDDFEILKKAAEDAQKKFKKDRTRTIILINEFDGFVHTNSSRISSMKDFMNNCSDKYHCTVFVTTNYPEKSYETLLSGSTFYKVGLPPANKKNAAAILKHYAEDFADKDVNYEELASHIIEMQPGKAFSNARIKSAVKELIESKKAVNNENLNTVITDKGPDINEESIQLFNNQLKYIKKISNT